MAYVQIRYSSSAFDSIIEKVKLSFSYSVEEKNTLHNMLMQMKHIKITQNHMMNIKHIT